MSTDSSRAKPVAPDSSIGPVSSEERPKSAVVEKLLYLAAISAVAGLFGSVTALGTHLYIGQASIREELGELRGEVKAIPKLIDQFEKRFASDIDQHDKRFSQQGSQIENNAANSRTIMRMLEGRDG